MKPLFILSFLKRYWKLLVFFVAIEALRHVDAVTYTIGPVFFLVELVVGAITCALLVRNLFMRNTLDHYNQPYIKRANGRSVSEFYMDWEKLEPYQKVFLSLMVLMCFFLGACWIAASIAK